MRTIGFIISVLLLWPVVSCHDASVKKDQIGASIQLPALLPSPFAVQKTTQKNTDTIDTGQLKQSSWYADAIRNIEESEYEIKQVDNSNEFASPNRQQNLRAFYTADKFTLEPRADDNWKLELKVKGVYSGKRKIYSPKEDAIAVADKNNIQFNHNDEFTVEYINSKEGVRQNFIIEKEPAAKPQTLNIKLQTNRGWFINRVHPKEIHFAKVNGDKVEKKLNYNDLKVWDANNKELPASFSVINNEISINVKTDNAVYPITVDPISTTANWSVESNQSGAYYGWSVASVGDVNGDGYSDIIVGAETYDNGEADEGKVFVYHGSATGLSATANWTTESDQVSAQMGLNVNTAGDVNGDGYSDIIIGVPRYDNGNSDEGRALVFHGSATGLLLTANWNTEINQNDAWYGASVACAGDVNGDGYSDVIVGSPYYDNGNTDEGKAYLYYGSSSGLLTTIAWSAEGNQDGAYFGGTQSGFVGTGVASAGDINGDSFSDVLLAAPGYDNGEADEGRVFLFHGSASGLSASANWIAESDQAIAYMGNSLASAGDVNGDGYGDVIVGAFTYDNGQANEGRAYVYHGSASGLSVTANWTAEPDLASSLFGCSVACAGDVNGDGYSDVIVGASIYTNGQSNEGAAFAYFGSPTGLSVSYNWIVEGNLTGATLGGTLSPAGDVNGDGYSDVLVGAFDYANGQADEGGAFVYHGSPDGLNTTAIWTVEGNQGGAKMGYSLAGVGDVNGDGYSDVIVGALNYDNGHTDEGAAFVYHGSATGISIMAAATVESDQTNAKMGGSVAGAGDVNGDGYSDVIVGALLYDNGSTDEGAAFVYLGSATGINTSVATILDCNQANAEMGRSVSGAGDVNGDGYGDVIVGAYNYDNVETNEGAAFVYYGSAIGVGTTAAATVESNQANALMGVSVATAGDVNGDGFSDVIVGAWSYDSGLADEGAAFVYHGSATGINTIATSIVESNQASAYMGFSVAGAGDVNGDGYSDVIVGAVGYDGGQTDEGAAFVYHGTTTGINTIAAAIVESNQVNVQMGLSVASAGDVNGDGYSDVIIGAIFYDNGQTDEGAAFVCCGSTTGINTSPSAIVESNQATAYMGTSVAGAGDVNGDGYSDVIVGAHFYDNGATDEGIAFAFYGNKNGGLRNNLRLYNSDLITPIQQSNMADPNLFGAGLYAKSFIGRQKGKLTWQTVKNGVAFTGSPITNSTAYTSQDPSLTDLGLTGTELKHTIAKQFPAKATYIRARIKYDLATAITGQVYGPWRYPEGFLRGRRDVGSVALPVKFISFTAIKGNSLAKLKWITTEEEPGVRFEVQHNIDGTNFTTLTSVNGRNQTRNEYEWLHTSPAKGNNFYRIKAIEQNKQAFTVVRMLYFGNDAVMVLYPNPVAAGQVLTIENDAILQNEQLFVSLSSFSGQPIFEKNIKATENGKTAINIPVVPSGAYLLLLRAGQREYRGKIVLRTK